MRAGVCMFVCVFVCACVRACVRACVCVHACDVDVGKCVRARTWCVLNRLSAVLGS